MANRDIDSILSVETRCQIIDNRIEAWQQQIYDFHLMREGAEAQNTPKEQLSIVDKKVEDLWVAIEAAQLKKTRLGAEEKKKKADAENAAQKMMDELDASVSVT